MNSNSVSLNKSWERLFFTTMAMAIIAVVFVGFSKSFFLRPWFPEVKESTASESIFYIHGVLFSAWMVLLLVQAMLVKTRKIELHRTLGKAGVVLAIAMVVIGIYASLIAARRPEGFTGVPVPPLQFLVVPVFDMIIFGLFVALAAAWRRNTQSHKRLMLLATINIVEAAIIRIPIPIIANGGALVSFWFADIFLVLLVIWDLVSMRRIHPVTLWAGLVTLASQPLRFWVAETDTWLTLAAWATGLPN